ncbi:MAG: (2Fe-2S)-binding protein [Phenylobacterium sp.]|uniref:2Fe-2S iron-sulfur cluster-binding protein n=1 Tax=Phenylobacterium sp. TaxID=1871053 RepID=UPI001A20A128|nr:2Fe-2S iron-sulfur cluster-binding protein [Phenylobacterium sp.]MBJ7408772.1 (2Fe-2S)-binding protein [Phenylobacterium sp.]
MPKIIFIQHDGAERTVETANGSAMQAAVSHGVRGIDGDCGGAAACATCHVYVHTDWLARTGPRGEMEAAMLEFAEEVLPNSRLACQIQLTDGLDGLVLMLPAAQH